MLGLLLVKPLNSIQLWIEFSELNIIFDVSNYIKYFFGIINYLYGHTTYKNKCLLKTILSISG